MTTLLAKSRPQDGSIPFEITLAGHTRCVVAAVAALFGQPGKPTRLGRSWLRFFRLKESDFDAFLMTLTIAAIAHDWGKAGNLFQGALLHGTPQGIRHEIVTGLILAECLRRPPCKQWLEKANVRLLPLIASCLGHHLKFAETGCQSLKSLFQLTPTFSLPTDHADFQGIWREIQEQVGSPCPEPIAFERIWRGRIVSASAQALDTWLSNESNNLDWDSEQARWIRAIRSGLIAADAVGSAVVRMSRDEQQDAPSRVSEWIAECFASSLTGDEVWEKVTSPRIEDLTRRGRWDDSKGFTYRGRGGFNQFQVDVASMGPRVFLHAPCGAGKTLAAWNWIVSQLEQNPAARVIFLYPTRATATEGFRDYVAWAPEAEAGFLTGTSDYELQGMFQTPNESAEDRQNRDYRTDPRLYTLGYWPKRIFAATVDQFLAFMQQNYSPICLLPLLAESVVVIDEVHSFDQSMFSTLRRFLQEFTEIPVLCMTATLSKERKESLTTGCGLTPYPEQLPPDLETIATQPRYGIEWVERDEAMPIVQDALGANRRVLWVSNRVNDCQETFLQLTNDPSIPSTQNPFQAFCYHSRFTLDDRKTRHAQLIEAFQASAAMENPTRGVLGVTTQVCEMSLDLDAEILVTELAPIAALIQRMGRCNRDFTKLLTRPRGLIRVIRPDLNECKPYERADLEKAVAFIDKLVGREISQHDLEVAYAECDEGIVEPTKVAAFLESGIYAEGKVEPFRDIDDRTVRCVLDNDLGEVRKRIQGKASIDGFIVPVPFHDVIPRTEDHLFLPHWLGIASGDQYNPGGKPVGFMSAKRNHQEKEAQS